MLNLGITNIGSSIDLGAGEFLLRNRRIKKRLRDALNTPNSETFLCKQFADGTDRLELLTSPDQMGRLDNSDICAQVTMKEIPCELSFAGLRDKDGTEFDLTVACVWKIGNRRTFLRDYGLQKLKVSGTIELTGLETKMAQSCQAGVVDKVRVMQYDALKNGDSLPADWWNTQIPQWVKLDWLELVEVLHVRYESATADRAAEIERRRKLQQMEDEESTQRREREKLLTQEQAEYQECLSQVEHSQELSEQERAHRSTELKAKHEEELLLRRRESEVALLEHERQKAALLAEIEECRNRKDAVQEILDRFQETEQRIKDSLQTITTAQQQQLEETRFYGAVPGAARYDDRMCGAVAGVSTGTMSLLGEASGAKFLAQVFREKAAASPGVVMLKMSELISRDILTKKVDSLPINSTLAFEFLTNRAGYAAFLNIGTSGAVIVQAPNAFVDVDQCRVEAGRRYKIPNPDWLPLDELDYVESGPVGWEELIILVSDEPFITEADRFASSESNPFVILPSPRIEELLNLLSQRPTDSWDAGVCSFLVE